MSPKELLYLEDALGHAQFLSTQCQEAAEQLRDAELRQCAQRMASQHQQMFERFYQLV